jgi:hypothetical protein
VSNGKRFALPTQKGTELFPNVTQPPAKLVIRGVPPDAPLYRAVAITFAGRLKSFHAKAQQGYAISDNQQYQVSWSWGDARATYTNQFGNETLVLEVSQSVLEQLSETLTTRRLPSWALARFELPILGNFGNNDSPWLDSTELYAVLRGATHTRDSLMTSSGTAGIWSKPFNIIGFAGTDPKRFGPYGIQADSDSDTTEVELLVDLRPFWTPAHAPSLTIDIYASAVQQVPDHLYGWRNALIPHGNTEMQRWAHNDGVAGPLEKYQGWWDDAGLPHSTDSLFVNGQEVAVSPPDTVLGFVAADGPSPPYEITIGLPNFLTDKPPGYDLVDGWRTVFYETDPMTGLITAEGWNNLIWASPAGEGGAITVFVLTEAMSVRHYEIVEVRGNIGEPYVGPGNVRGEVLYDDLPWIERTWFALEGVFYNSHWVTTTAPNARNLPIIARDVFWPNEDFPFIDYAVTPPSIKQDKYLLGTLTVDIETGSIGFSKA